MDNTSRYERSVLSGILVQSLPDLQRIELGDGLRGKTWRLASNVVLAKTLVFSGCSFSVDDVVCFLQEGCFGKVAACVLEQELSFIVCEILPVRKLSPYGWHCRWSGVQRAWAASAVQLCTAWKVIDDEHFEIVLK